jgi:hypothetical protein
MTRSWIGWLPLALVGLAACSDTPVNVVTVPAPGARCVSNGVTFGAICAITVPGAAVISGAKGWVDPNIPDFYFNDQSNASLDVISTTTYTYVGRVPGFVGAATGASGGTITYGGGTATSNGQGPNSVVPTVSGTVWVSDGNSQVQVVNVASLAITKTISTAVAACDGGTATTHFCGRTNEMTYDPNDDIIMVENPNPLSLAYCSVPANAAVCATAAAVSFPTNASNLPSYATFIKASTYAILGTISFTDVAGTTEAPVWDAAVGGTGRFLVPVPSCSATFVGTTCSSVANGATQYIAVIDPKNLAQYAGTYSAATAIAGSVPYAIPNCTALGSAGNTGMINDMTLDSADQTVIMPTCGHEVVFSATTGTVLNNAVIAQVGSSDETAFNPGDGNFYVVGTVPVGQPLAGSAALGQVNGKTGLWVQNVYNPGGKDPATSRGTNRVFTFVTPSVAQAANPASDTTACAAFGPKGYGCIVVFGK